MPCEKLLRLQAARKSAQQQFSQYAYKENQHLWGVSKTEAARIAREAQTKMGELGNEIFAHEQSCEICKSAI